MVSGLTPLFKYDTVISPSGRTCTKLKFAMRSPPLIMIDLPHFRLGLVHAVRKILKSRPVPIRSVTTVYRSPAPVAEPVLRGSTAMCGDCRNWSSPVTLATVPAGQQDALPASVCVPLGHAVELRRFADVVLRMPTAFWSGALANLRSTMKNASRAGSAITVGLPFGLNLLSMAGSPPSKSGLQLAPDLCT